MARLTLENVSKRHPDGTEALREVSLEVPDGALFTLVGPSGCGKSTLLSLIAGLDRATDGAVRIDGEVVNALAPGERDIAMVFQSYALYPHLTVAGNLAFPLEVARMPRRERDARVAEVAELLGLSGLLQRRPSALSGGQRQRVALGRALVRRPRLFLFDEPLSNLDAALRVQMRAELKALHQRLKATFIYVTHDQVEAMSLADRIAVMHEGRIVQAAPATEVYHHPATRFVGGFIGNPPMNFLPAEREGEGARVAGHLFRDAPAADAALLFGIRPEDLVPAGEGLAGRVRVVEPLGPHQLVTMDLAGHLFRVVLDNDLAVRPGETLTLAPRPGRVRWFDADSGVSLTQTTQPEPATGA